MVRDRRPLAVTAVLALSLLCAVLVSGCGKYDALERNAQYVSDDLARENAHIAYVDVVKAYERWKAAGGGREAGNQAFAAYSDIYAQYAIMYNELWERKGGGFSGHLHSTPTDDMPPPPPGEAAIAPKSVAPQAKPASDAPQGRDLHDDAAPAAAPAPTSVAPRAPAGAAAGIPMPQTLLKKPAPVAADANPFAPIAGKGAPKAQAAGGNSYVVAPGDNLRKIAKQFGVSEKSLMDANGLSDPDKLAAGKSIVIPTR